MKNHTLHVSGTHCASCKILIEDALGEENIVKRIEVNLRTETLDIDTYDDIDSSELAKFLTSKIEQSGYKVFTEKIIKEKEKDNITWKAIFIGLVALGLFFLLQKSGILNLGLGEISPVTSFIVGLIASVSSCLAIVGGLVLSLSVKVAEDQSATSQTQTFAFFHLSRIISFAILGGVLGLIGEVIGISFLFSAILGIIAALVMIILGANLVGIFKKNRLTLPTSVFSKFKKAEASKFAPIIIGFGTFFLPCGFTQAMQVAALSSGSFISGLLIMFSFALGTLPVLALLSFGSKSFSQSKNAPLFFKSAGVVVLGLGLFSLISSLQGVGIISPFINI